MEVLCPTRQLSIWFGQLNLSAPARHAPFPSVPLLIWVDKEGIRFDVFLRAQNNQQLLVALFP